MCASFVLHGIKDVVYEHVLVFSNSSSKNVDIALHTLTCSFFSSGRTWSGHTSQDVQVCFSSTEFRLGLYLSE